MFSISFAVSVLLFSIFSIIHGLVEAVAWYFFLFPGLILCFSSLALVTFLQRKKKDYFVLGLILLLVSIVLFGISLYFLFDTEQYVEKNYMASVADSVFIEEEEIMPLVTIDEDSPFVTWSSDGDKVLMLSWNDSPEEYLDGSTITVDGEIWTFTDREIAYWYADNQKGIKDWNLRLKQLIGLPPNSDYTHVTAFWCDPEELIRPCYQIDITKQLDSELLDGSALGSYKAWFDGNTMWSYFDSAYPWTRLGYTYDWKDGEDEYGLSEFLIIDNSEVEIEWTKSTEDFLLWLGESV